MTVNQPSCAASTRRLPVRLAFRTPQDLAQGKPAPGELWLVPGEEPRSQQRQLALLAQQRGAAGFLQAAGAIESICIQSDPTLDDMLAASFLTSQLQGNPLPAEAEAFARYAALAREGLRPSQVPLEESLEGMFLALRSQHQGDLRHAQSADPFVADWLKIWHVIVQAAKDQLDPFCVPLFEHRTELARERAFLMHDRQVYRQDVARGEQWIVQLPGGPPRAAALVLREPKSVLWKYWSREDETGPTGQQAYLFLAVQREARQWVFSTDPIQRLSLQGLADALQHAESERDSRRAERDPWFDGKPFGHTLIAAPRKGSLLEDAEVLRIVRHWTTARPLRPMIRRRVALSAVAIATGLLLAGIGWWSFGRSRTVPDGARLPTSEPYQAETTSPLRPGLQVLAVGVAKYADASYNLAVADQDAEALARAFEQQEDRLFKQVHTRTLLNTAATKDAILKELRALQRSVSQYDLAVVTFSGHGVADEFGDFFFLPYDYDATKELGTSGISWDDLRRSLGRMPCQVVLLMDTCQSGAVTRAHLRALVRVEVESATAKAIRQFSQADKGLVIIAAALGEQKAEERSDWGHGALTLAFLEGILGRPLYQSETRPPLPQEISPKGIITLQQIDAYVTSRVKELTDGRQAVITNHTGNISLDLIPVTVAEP